jgi:hypothetical protein
MTPPFLDKLASSIVTISFDYSRLRSLSEYYKVTSYPAFSSPQCFKDAEGAAGIDFPHKAKTCFFEERAILILGSFPPARNSQHMNVTHNHLRSLFDAKRQQLFND